jgi:hypothetical protein
MDVTVLQVRPAGPGASESRVLVRVDEIWPAAAGCDRTEWLPLLHVRPQSRPYSDGCRAEAGDLVVVLRSCGGGGGGGGACRFLDAEVLDLRPRARAAPDGGAGRADDTYARCGDYFSAADETPRGIARRLGLSVETVVDMNRRRYPPLGPGSRLLRGTQLMLPAVVGPDVTGLTHWQVASRLSLWRCLSLHPVSSCPRVLVSSCPRVLVSSCPSIR